MSEEMMSTEVVASTEVVHSTGLASPVDLEVLPPVPEETKQVNLQATAERIFAEWDVEMKKLEDRYSEINSMKQGVRFYIRALLEEVGVPPATEDAKKI